VGYYLALFVLVLLVVDRVELNMAWHIHYCKPYIDGFGIGISRFSMKNWAIHGIVMGFILVCLLHLAQ